MDMGQYLQIFIEESNENLQNMNQCLLDLENNHHDLDLVNEIFRIAHTLKGMAGTMGFSKLASITHEMEDVLQSLRSGEIKVSEDIIDVLFECFDILQGIINEIINTGEEGEIEPSSIILRLKKVQNNNSIIIDDNEEEKINIEVEEFSRNTIANAILSGYKVYKIKVELNAGCMLKSARAFIVFNTLERDSEVIRSNPPVEDIEDEKFEDSFEIIIVSKLSKEKLKNDILSISEIKKVVIEEVTKEELNLFNENSITVLENTTQNELEHMDSESNEEIEDDHNKEKAKNTKPKIGKTVRVDIDRLDNLMNLVSELIIIKTRLEDIDDTSKSNMNEAVEYLERITTSLHDAVMKVRMVSIERVFNRFPRMVRDLSKELGKEISLYMSGEETEVDRTVIDEIGEPLIHLIRNSIDHGIEDPGTRKVNGKNVKGMVKLVAYPDGNSVVIEVEDDGQGVNLEKVKAKAIQKGLITKDQGENLENQEILQLLFHPGFSTADKISDISGRGVGLDVVKTKIESLGGIIEVETEKDKGSKFTIRLPLTLAIIQALLVNVGIEKYAVPLSSIKEIITIDKSDIKHIQKREVVMYRNTTLPILRMNKILEVEGGTIDENELTVVVVKKGEKIAGFVVDSLIGQQEIVIKSLGKYLSGIKLIAGATILGNGQVALIVDTNSLL